MKARADQIRREQWPVHLVLSGSSALLVGLGLKETMAHCLAVLEQAYLIAGIEKHAARRSFAAARRGLRGTRLEAGLVLRRQEAEVVAPRPSLLNQPGLQRL